MRWPTWAPGPVPFSVWIATRATLLALVGGFYPWDWYPDLLYEWVITVGAGGNPYQGGQAYPPLSMLAFLIPGAISPSHAVFRTVYPLFIVAIDLALLLWMRRAERDGLRHATLGYALAIPAIGPVMLLWRFDLLPVLCQIAATVCALRAGARPDLDSGARRWSWAWLGLGIALKLYLLALVPLWLAWEMWRGGGRGALTWRGGWRTALAAFRHPELAAFARRAASGLALALAPVVVLAAVALAVWGPRTLEPYTYSFGRAITVDSTAGVVIAELGRAGVPVEWAYAPECFCPVRSAGPAIDTAFRAASSVVGVAGVLLFALWYTRRPGPARLVAAAAGTTAVLTLASPLLSPQHFLWPLAPLALLAGYFRGRIALGLAIVAALIAAVGMLGPEFHVHPVEYTDTGRLMLITRALAELGAVVALVWPTGLELGTARAVRMSRRGG